MIRIVEQKEKICYCNVCQQDNKNAKYYQLEFINKINQGIVVALCETCLNDLTIKLLRKEVDSDDR